MSSPKRRRNRPVKVFDVEFEHISFVLSVLELPMQSLKQIETRYGSLDEYIARKYPNVSKEQILDRLLNTPKTIIRDPVNRRLVEIFQESLQSYVLSHPDMPRDKIYDRLCHLAWSQDFLHDIRMTLRRY